MNTDIIDAPLDALSSDRPTRLAIVSSRLDFGINSFFLIIWTCCFMAAIISEGMISLLAVVHFFMGCYQFASTLVGAIRRQRPKLIYLIIVIAYALLVALLTEVTGFNSTVELFLFIGLFPFIGAVYYMKLSYDVRDRMEIYK